MKCTHTCSGFPLLNFNLSVSLVSVSFLSFSSLSRPTLVSSAAVFLLSVFVRVFWEIHARQRNSAPPESVLSLCRNNNLRKEELNVGHELRSVALATLLQPPSPAKTCRGRPQWWLEVTRVFRSTDTTWSRAQFQQAFSGDVICTFLWQGKCTLAVSTTLIIRLELRPHKCLMEAAITAPTQS